jgi:hypothetical protein
MYHDCEHAEVYRDEEGRIEEAFCRLGHFTCGACEDYLPDLWQAVEAEPDRGVGLGRLSF